MPTCAGFPASIAVNEAPRTLFDGVSDHELMLEVRAGDVARLGELFERHHGPLYGYFVRLTGDHASSEDLVQLVFQRILRYRRTYRDEGNFSAWMYRIARHALADYQRRAGGLAPAAAEPELEALPDHAPHAADAAGAHDDVRLLHEALADLTADEREILVLARFQEMPHAEIAAVLRISPGAVRVRVHRAMKQLRSAFLGLCDDGTKQPISPTHAQGGTHEV